MWRFVIGVILLSCPRFELITLRGGEGPSVKRIRSPGSKYAFRPRDQHGIDSQGSFLDFWIASGA